MCGVAGILAFDGRGAPRALVARMTDALVHRGPDGEGLLELGPAVFGHRRLAVIDPGPGGAQPMQLEERGLALTYNGELYNYVELREELRAAGHRFRSESDTEVVLAAYAEWGLEAFARFNGMWALAIWDARERRLVLSRDRFGIKPLYLLEDANRLLFASEPKALLAAVPEANDVDLGVLGRFLSRGVQDDGPRTFFARIRQLTPATTLTVDADGRRREHVYWRFDPHAHAAPHDPAQALRALLDDAVRLRLRSDVPVGTCLSGGLDSSSVAALASGHHAAPVRTFTAVFDAPGFDEREHARAVARRFGCEAREVAPRPGRRFVELVDAIGYYHDEPCARPGLVTQWHVMALAQGQATVLLDGQGGDEVLLGYTAFALPYLRSLAREAARSPAQLPKLLRDAAGLLAQPSTSPRGRASLLRHLARAARARLQQRAVLAPELVHAATALDHERGAAVPVNQTRIDRALLDSLTRDSIPALLHHEDRASMAFSLEARLPFLDHRVVELALSTDYKRKVDGGRTKAVLRDAMADLLPPEVVERRDKLGTPAPLAAWLRGDPAVRDVLLGGFAGRGYVDAAAIDDAWRALIAHQDDGWQLYRWLTTELWLRRFVDAPPAPPSPSDDLPLPRQGSAPPA